MGTSVATSVLTVKAVEFEEELRLASTLMAQTYADETTFSSTWFQTNGASYPESDRAHTRIALCNGEVAGALRITEGTIRLGEARLRAGGLGWVATSPRYGRRGIQTILMQDAQRYMKLRGYHVSILFGVVDLFLGFGYAQALEEHTIELDTIEPPLALNRHLRVRPVKPGDIGALQKMYTENTCDVACSLLRSRAHFTNKWERFKSARVITNAKGKLQAYVLAHSGPSCLEVEEVGIANPALVADVYALCASMARKRCLSKVRYSIPSDHPFSRHFPRYENGEHASRQIGVAGMMAFVDIGETLESTIPEWESLLLQSVLRDVRCEVTIVIDRENYRIRVHRGAIDIARASGKNKFSVRETDFMQLLTGYTALDELYARQRRMISSEAQDLLRVLFPKRNPYVAPFDRF